MLTKKELNKSFREGLITENKYKEELFKIETTTTTQKKKSKRIYEKVTEEEYILLLKNIKNKNVMIAFKLAYDSGLRLQEILNLEHDDININRKSIFVRQGKNNEDRTVNIPDKFKKEWLKLFPLKITKGGVQKAFFRASIKTNINKVIYTYKAGNQERKKYRLHFHCLRHSYGTNLIENGVPLNKVQLLMGHSNVSITSLYIKADPREAIQELLDKGIIR